MHAREVSVSPGNAEMVKKIGMSVGGPSLSQVRGMRPRDRGGAGKKTREKKLKMKINLTTRAGRDMNTRKVLGKKCQRSEKFALGAHRPVQTAKKDKKKQRTNGRNVCGVEIILGKSDDQTCFAHTAVSD